MTVNIGTIGHVDHGKTTLAATLVKALGKEMANQCVVVDADGAEELRRKGLIRDAITETIDECAHSLFGRPRSKSRKAERQARLKAAMFKAAGGRP